MIHYDIIIIGGGLSGLLQADRISDLENRDLKIAIVDPEPTSLQSKTLSSWRRSAEGLHRYSGLVSHRWQKFRVVHSDGRSVERAFGGYVYETISGSDLFGFLHSKLTKDARFVWRQAKVQAVHEFRQPDSRNRVARVQLSNGEVLHADQVLSSPAIHETPVLQYFLGFEIEATSNVFDPEAVDLMDFRVDQGRDVRFVYILPYSQRRALVEFTVFSESRLSTEECERHLRHYLAVHKNLHSFSILKTESGIIPMSEDCVPLFPPAFQSTCIRGIGGASSRVKPSTGYSFQRNLLDPRERGLRTFLNFRFRIYDSILLEIIRSEGARGADVFFRLFSGNSPEMVFSFLDERTRIREEARIFRALPWGLFLSKCARLYPYLFCVIATLGFQKMIGGWSAWMIPVMGLVTTGIGHGGLDPFSRPPEQSKLGFYLRYLGLMAGFLVCWKVFPLLATSIFIFMSAGHFGETEWQRPLRISGNDFRLRVLSWVWGLFASVFSVLFHWEEALPLIQKIAGDLPFNGGSSGPEVARGLGLLLLLLAFGSARILDSYDQRASGRDPSGVLGTLILAIFFSVLPLLAGFFCFFAFWHAWDSIRIQRRRLGLGYLDYAKKAFPLTLIAWGGMGLLFGLSWVLDRGTSFWSVLFVMIGALTTAHAPLMSHFLLREAPGKRRVLNPGA